MTITSRIMKNSSPPREDIKDEFILSLLEMDSRIRTVPYSLDFTNDLGYFPTKDVLVLAIHVPNINHEIAHMVEMRNLERCTKPDWGFINFGSDSSDISKVCKSKESFFAAISREIRVRAIQLHLGPEKVNSYSATYDILKNYFLFDAIKNRLPFGKFSSILEVQEWANDLRDKTFFAWSPERIRHEWITRLDYIRNWMETR